MVIVDDDPGEYIIQNYSCKNIYSHHGWEFLAFFLISAYPIKIYKTW